MSLASKAALLALIFLVVPVILYDQFRAADQNKRLLVTNSVRDQGRTITVALSPMLNAPGAPNLPAIGQELSRFDNQVTTVKLLYQPASDASQGFFYVASSAPLANDALDTERETLRRQGVLDRLQESCAGDVPIELRYTAPDGHDEVVTSLIPVLSPSGCWAVVTSLSANAVPGVALGVPYYDTPEVRLAALIYLAMAALTFTMFWSIWRGLLQFGERARAIRSRNAQGRLWQGMAMRGRILAGHEMLDLPLDIGQQAGGADAEQLRYQPVHAQFLADQGEHAER